MKAIENRKPVIVPNDSTAIRLGTPARAPFATEHAHFAGALN